MFSLNRATILGNVTHDPEPKQLATGQSVCTFSVATNRVWTGSDGVKQEKAEFHNVVAWRKLADICAQYLKKGRKVYVEGYLQTRDWQGQDGVKRYRTEIVAENIILVDRPSTGQPSPSTPFTPPKPIIKDEPASNPDDEIRIEEIPF
jgi:single-strand DNA-binding protein